MTKNVFITGGLGQDGKILTNLLISKNIRLNVFFRNKKKIIKKKNINFLYSNLKDKRKLNKIFLKNKPDVVVHFAANNPSYKQKSYKTFYKENMEITKNIFYSTFNNNIKAKFIFCSSSQIFKKKNGLVNERSKTIVNSPYTKFRINADNFMLKFKKKENINYTNAILFNHDSEYRNKKFIIPKLISHIKKKKIGFIDKIINENIYADFSHAIDICNGIKKLIFSKLNLDKIIFSSNKKTSLNEIIFYIVKKNNIKININPIKKNSKKGLIGNNKLAKQKLKWIPKKNIFIAAQEIFKLNL